GEGTGIEQTSINSDQLKVYPNPAQNVLNLKGTSELKSAVVYDATGRLIMQVELDNTLHAEMNISTLKNGLYLIEVSSVKGASKTTRFIKK
ncbi:MAG TPA: T9SS type A sorting domain-containing protein, partial [Bacteroidales bacterium]|nr:T9SS type A sorting domain-containing protein [Bacteroidales bacterium]